MRFTYNFLGSPWCHYHGDSFETIYAKNWPNNRLEPQLGLAPYPV